MSHGVLADTPPGRPRHPRGCPRRIPSRGGANAEFVVVAGGHHALFDGGLCVRLQGLVVAQWAARFGLGGQCAVSGRQVGEPVWNQDRSRLIYLFRVVVVEIRGRCRLCVFSRSSRFLVRFFSHSRVYPEQVDGRGRRLGILTQGG